MDIIDGYQLLEIIKHLSLKQQAPLVFINKRFYVLLDPFLPLSYKITDNVDRMYWQLDCDFNPNHRYGEPLCVAAKAGYTRICEIMINHPKHDPTMDIGNNTLHKTIKYGNLETFTFLFQYGWLRECPYFNLWNEFIYAVQKDRFCVVDYFIKELGVDPSRDDNIAIFRAAWLSDVSIVDRLLQDPRVDPNRGIHHSAFIQSVRVGNIQNIERLLQDHRTDVQEDGLLAMHFAIDMRDDIYLVCQTLLQDSRIVSICRESPEEIDAIISRLLMYKINNQGEVLELLVEKIPEIIEWSVSWENYDLLCKNLPEQYSNQNRK